MRKKLATQEGERKKFIATFCRLGKKTSFTGYSEETILLTDVREAETNKFVTDHLWFAYTLGFGKITLTAGTVLEFEARIKKYEKGFVNKSLRVNHRSTDYKLSHPTKIKKVKEIQVPSQ